jgi:heme exporter protein C
MKHWWWKLLGVLLLLGASVAALRVPLSPALVHVEPGRIAPGPVELTLTGYNTHFAQEGVKVFLENGGERLCATEVQVLSPTLVQARFDVPEGLRDHLSNVVVVDVTHGRLAIPGAVFTTGTGDGSGVESCAETLADAAPVKTFTFPNRNILYESIRNLCFHVPMWFAMIVLMAISVWKSVRALGSNDLDDDRAALHAVQVGLLFCGMGLVTGSIWARATWGTWWTNDVKLNGSAVTALIYLAYLVLRGSVQDPHKRARLAGIYNIFAFALLVMFLFVVPRLNAVDSLHPANGGNDGFGDLDLDDRLRTVFYPACMGWILMATWMYDLRLRAARLQERLER